MTNTPAGSRILPVLIALLLVAATAAAQQQNPPGPTGQAVIVVGKDETDPAVKLLDDAIKANKADVDAWHKLGVLREKQRQKSEALKAYEKAARLGEAFILRQFGAATFPASAATDFSTIKSAVGPAGESADAFMRLSSNLTGVELLEWQERTRLIHDFEALSQPGRFNILASREVTTKPQVLSKPEPSYTLAARQSQVTGTVTLRLLLAETGSVLAIVPISRLPQGLTEKSVQAARQIRFTPATKDGKPVSMWLLVQYNFNLY